jgi:hypothetical protein
VRTCYFELRGGHTIEAKHLLTQPVTQVHSVEVGSGKLSLLGGKRIPNVAEMSIKSLKYNKLVMRSSMH